MVAIDIPIRVQNHVRRKYGVWADKILQESQDPRFCNPIVIVDVQTGETVSRIEEFWRRPWSVQEPEKNSLTELYRETGVIVSTGDGFKFRKGAGKGALDSGGFPCACSGLCGAACACGGARDPKPGSGDSEPSKPTGAD